jgi:hypothetical protein
VLDATDVAAGLVEVWAWGYVRHGECSLDYLSREKIWDVVVDRTR